MKKSKNKKNILYIVDFLYPPTVTSAGMKAVLKQILKQSELNNVFIFTIVNSDATKDFDIYFKKLENQYNLKIFYINNTKKSYRNRFFSQFINRIKLYLKSIYIVKKYNIDIVHEYSSMALLLYISLLFKIFKIKYIHTLTGFPTISIASPKYWPLFEKTNKIIFAGKGLETLYKKHEKKYKHKSIYLSFGIDIKKFSKQLTKEQIKKIKNHFKIPNKKKIITYIGPIEKRKGAFLFANIMNKVLDDLELKHKVHFLVITYGKGPIDPNHDAHKKQFFKIIKNNKKYLTFLEGHQNIINILQITDIFIMPTVNLRGTLAEPLTLLEALANKRIVVASDIIGIKELININKNGFLAKTNELDFKQKIKNILYFKNQQIQQIRNNAYSSVQDLDIDKLKHKLNSIYDYESI